MRLRPESTVDGPSHAVGVEAFSVDGMTSRARFTLEGASAAGKRFGVDWVLPLRPRAVLAGMDVELEHGPAIW
jgi:hypothetical protein